MSIEGWRKHTHTEWLTEALGWQASGALEETWVRLMCVSVLQVGWWGEVGLPWRGRVYGEGSLRRGIKNNVWQSTGRTQWTRPGSPPRLNEKSVCSLYNSSSSIWNSPVVNAEPCSTVLAGFGIYRWNHAGKDSVKIKYMSQHSMFLVGTIVWKGDIWAKCIHTQG